MTSRNAKRSSVRSPATVDAIESIPHDQIWLDSSWRSRLRKRLLSWFAKHARTLPWRSDPHPYRVWVSEIMLQQTQVATVLPYFERFLTSFPTVNDLAQASEDELLKHWEGLGYYRRARSLHVAAKRIVADHGGQFPSHFADAIALPGIGRYTAGAILSISADQKLPVLEGNTQRVFSRWVALRQPPTEPLATKLLWRIAERMLPPKGSGQFNQAAMELGALVCLPRAPKCEQCPVRRLCRAAHCRTGGSDPRKIGKNQLRVAYRVCLRGHRSPCCIGNIRRRTGEVFDETASPRRPLGWAMGFSATD